MLQCQSGSRAVQATFKSLIRKPCLCGRAASSAATVSKSRDCGATPSTPAPAVELHVFRGREQTGVKLSQAPNREETWAPSQRPRSEAMTGPRFDGRDLSTQPKPYAAIELIAKEPVVFVDHLAVCDGNKNGVRGGVQGHPRVYINVEAPGTHTCTYCGIRYADEKYRSQIEGQPA